jgi:hypothetical protein
MRTRSLMPALCLLLAAAPARPEAPRSMGAERIREAIAFGERAAGDLEAYDLLRRRAYVVNCDTPFLRVARLARSVKTQNGSLNEADLPSASTAEVVHVYVHARYEAGSPEAFPEVEQVLLAKLNPDGTTRFVMPSSYQTFLRRVPVADDYEGPTRLARSAMVVFPLHAFSAGMELRIRFQGGYTEALKLDEARLAQLR